LFWQKALKNLVNMVKIANLIRNKPSRTQSECSLIVSPDTSVREAFAQMAEHDCDCIGIRDEGRDSPTILSKEDMLQGLLSELDGAEEKLTRTSLQIEDGMTEQLDLVTEGVKTLADSEKNILKAAIASMTEGLIILGAGGAIENINPPAKRLLALDGDDNMEAVTKVIDGLGLRELVLGNDGEGPNKWGEFKIKVARGRILQMKWTRMNDEPEQLLGHVVMIRDVTDQMAADRAKTEFIAAISHELRTPLTSIQNSVSNMLAGVTGKVSNKARQYLHTMKTDCHRFAGLINDLLDMAKLEAGNMPINRRVMNIVGIAGDVIKSFADKAKEKNIELTCEIDRHTSPVYADSRRISQVLWNFVSNAIKFTDQPGRVCVRSYDNDNDVITVVEDTGIGISDDLQKQIFNKFYQISRLAGPGYNGSGLGLAICDGIIAVHGGSIWVESEEGKGSKFYFSLPKTNPFIVLRKHLDALAQRSSSKGNEFGLIIANFDVPNEQREQLKHIVSLLTNEILTGSDHFLASSEDLAIRTEDFEMAFVVGDTQKRHIETVMEEIEKITQNKLRKNCGEVPILPMLGIAVYPRDSRDVAELEQIARHKLSRMF
jgi:signal transduction histidine kinase